MIKLRYIAYYEVSANNKLRCLNLALVNQTPNHKIYHNLQKHQIKTTKNMKLKE